MEVKFDYLFNKLIRRKDTNLKKIVKLLKEFSYEKVKENKYLNKKMGKVVVLNLDNFAKSKIINPRR